MRRHFYLDAPCFVFIFWNYKCDVALLSCEIWRCVLLNRDKWMWSFPPPLQEMHFYLRKNHNHVKINMTFNHTVKYSIVRGFPRLFCSWMKSLTGYLHTIFTAWLGVLQLEIDGWRRDRHCHFFFLACQAKKYPSRFLTLSAGEIVVNWHEVKL